MNDDVWQQPEPMQPSAVPATPMVPPQPPQQGVSVPPPPWQAPPPPPGYAAPGYPPPGYGAPGSGPAYGAPSYGPPGAYQYAMGGTQKNWMGILALVLSLASLCTGLTAIGGIVFGHLGLSAVKNGEANNRGLALAGLIIGYVIAGLWLLYVVVMVIAAFAAPYSY